MKLKYTVKNKQVINQILQKELNISSRLLYKLIRQNKILLNNNICDTRDIANIEDTIIIDFVYEEDNTNIVPAEMNLNIVYEDEWLLIINKPAGIAIHPSIIHYSDSLCNGVRFYFDSIGLKKKIRPVNRLDLNTSGLVIFAKCEYIQECLIRQMMNNSFKKEYLAICSGLLEKEHGIINLPISRKDGSIIERCISENGQKAITYYEVLKTFKNYSLIKCTLKTGRTHQIRVHMSAIDHSLIGDSLYGVSSNLINRQALHCYKLQFLHPVSKELLSFVGKVPEDFNKLLLE